MRQSGFTLVEVAVAMVVLAFAVGVGGIALNAIERNRGYRNALVEATILADNEAERVTAVNRSGKRCGDTTYTITCNKLPFTVSRNIGDKKASITRTRHSDNETIIAATLNGTVSHTWTFRMHQEVILDK